MNDLEIYQKIITKVIGSNNGWNWLPMGRLDNFGDLYEARYGERAKEVYENMSGGMVCQWIFGETGIALYVLPRPENMRKAGYADPNLIKKLKEIWEDRNNQATLAS
jgi:hypothetical protein